MAVGVGVACSFALADTPTPTVVLVPCVPDITLVPQPVKQGSTVYAYATQALAHSEWKVYAVDQQLVASFVSDDWPPAFTADLAPGLYLVHITGMTQAGQYFAVTKKLVVE